MLNEPAALTWEKNPWLNDERLRIYKNLLITGPTTIGTNIKRD